MTGNRRTALALIIAAVLATPPAMALAAATGAPTTTAPGSVTAPRSSPGSTAATPPPSAAGDGSKPTDVATVAIAFVALLLSVYSQIRLWRLERRQRLKERAADLAAHWGSVNGRPALVISNHGLTEATNMTVTIVPTSSEGGHPPILQAAGEPPLSVLPVGQQHAMEIGVSYDMARTVGVRLSWTDANGDRTRTLSLSTGAIHAASGPPSQYGPSDGSTADG